MKGLVGLLRWFVRSNSRRTTDERQATAIETER